MSYGMISGSKTTIHLCPKLPTTNSSSLVWRTNMVMKPSKSIRTPSGLYRARTRAAINCAYRVKQENLYELLGVSERDTPSEIKKAYKKLALKYHPDVSPPDLAAEYTGKFIRVQEAYETLSDPQSRAVYDRDLGTGFQLAYSKRRSHHDQRFEEWGDWRERWQSQLMELQRRSDIRDSTGGQAPWGAGMGSQRFSHAFHN